VTFVLLFLPVKPQLPSFGRLVHPFSISQCAWNALLIELPQKFLEQVSEARVVQANL
jgi:hypothetical protein